MVDGFFDIAVQPLNTSYEYFILIALPDLIFILFILFLFIILILLDQKNLVAYRTFIKLIICSLFLYSLFLIYMSSVLPISFLF